MLGKQPFLSLDRQGKHTFTEVKSPEHANVIFTHVNYNIYIYIYNMHRVDSQAWPRTNTKYRISFQMRSI